MPKPRAAFTLIEILIAASVVGLSLLAMAGFVGSTVRSTANERDRAFALQKALQMMEEMAAYKATGPSDKGIDKFASNADFALTTAAGAVPYQALSANPRINGKYRFVRQIAVGPVKGDAFARQVTVTVYYADKSGTPIIPASQKPLAVISNVLHANVALAGPFQVLDVYALSIENMPHVWRKDGNNHFYPSAADARRNFEGSLRDVQSMNAGISFRVHYITRLSVGRDDAYRPTINAAKGLDTTFGGTGGREPLDNAYFYPGLIEKTTGSPQYYDQTAIAGNLKLDGNLVGSYPLADQFNHAVRYPQEFDATNTPVRPEPGNNSPVTGNPGVATTDSLSLRQFLEDLLTAPTAKYRNAVLVNLHGELFPCLPLRPYADPARDVTDSDPLSAQRRVVTHPYKLLTPTSEPVKLLVHQFLSDGTNDTVPGGSPPLKPVLSSLALGGNVTNARVIVKGIRPYLDNMNLAPGDTANSTDLNHEVKITNIQREYKNVAGKGKYVQVVEWPDTIDSTANGDNPSSGTRADHSGPHVSDHSLTMHHGGTTLHHGYDPNWSSGPSWSVPAGAGPATGAGNDMVINLSDLDYDSRKIDDGSGTEYGIKNDNAHLLHRLQYFPDPYLPFLDEPNNGDKPRNTARNIIEFKLKPAAEGMRFEVVTQLMRADGSWATAPDPSISSTWIYMGGNGDWDATKGEYTANIPLTEQNQLVGDPRHNPYLDARMKGLYNPYWTDWTTDNNVYESVKNSGGTSNFAGPPNPLIKAPDSPPTSSGMVDTSFPNSADSWAHVKYDAPSYFKLWREALMRNNMVYVNVTGQPMRYLGLGGEFSLDKAVNGVGNLKVASKPWDGGGGNAGAAADELINGAATLVERGNGDRWYAKPWLGELYPDDQAGTWRANGNLPTNGGSGFHRDSFNGLANWPSNTAKADGDNKKLVDKDVGLGAFLNAKTSGSNTPLDVNSSGNNANAVLNATGQALYDSLRMTPPNIWKMDFVFDLTGGTNPPEWSSALYTANRTIASYVDAAFTPSSYVDAKSGTDHVVAPIKVVDPGNAANQMIVVPDTLKPLTMLDAVPLMDLASTAMLGAFFDGTQGSGAASIKPLPRVKLTQPISGASVSGSSVALKWYAKWVRADGTEYSPGYTYNRAAQAPLPVFFFVKYKSMATGVYCTARLSGGVTSAAVSSTVDPSADAGNIPLAPGVNPIPDPGYPNPIMANWDFTDPTGAALPNGDYVIRVEAYRQDPSGKLIPTHYAAHELPLTIEN